MSKPCNKPMKIFCRPCGYYAIVSQFNDGKFEEFKQRKDYRFKLDKNGEVKRVKA